MLEAIWPSRCAGCDDVGRGRLCPRCRPPSFHRVPVDIPGVKATFTLAGYTAPLGRALRVAKYGPDRIVAIELARAFAVAMTPAVRGGPWTWIAPAPTTWRSRFKRGFSVSAILARALGDSLGLEPVDVLRTTEAPRQAGRSTRGRLANVAGRVRCDTAVQGMGLLVDDVVTTGATARACAGELLGAGASGVWLLTLCAARTCPFATRFQDL